MNQEYIDYLKTQIDFLEDKRDEFKWEDEKHIGGLGIWDLYHKLVYKVRILRINSSLSYDHERKRTNEIIEVMKIATNLMDGYCSYKTTLFTNKYRFMRKITTTDFLRDFLSGKKEYQKEVYLLWDYYNILDKTVRTIENLLDDLEDC
jgi:hypothetical protein